MTTKNIDQAAQPNTQTFVYVVIERHLDYNDEYYRFSADCDSGRPQMVFTDRAAAAIFSAELNAKLRKNYSTEDFEYGVEDIDDTDFCSVVAVPVG